MNYSQYHVQGAGSPRIVNPHLSFLSSNHELICLGFEEALNFGFDAQSGTQSEEPKTFYLHVFDCPLTQFCDILKAATVKHAVAAANICGQCADGMVIREIE